MPQCEYEVASLHEFTDDGMRVVEIDGQILLIREGELLAHHVKDGVVAAACGFDRDSDTAALIELMTMRRDWTARELGERPAGLLAGAHSR
jgi:hypothetical protein